MRNAKSAESVKLDSFRWTVILGRPQKNYSLWKNTMDHLNDKSPDNTTLSGSNEELKRNFPISIKGHFRAILAAKEKQPISEDLDKLSDFELDDNVFEGFDEFFGDDSSDSQTESDTSIKNEEDNSETDTLSDIFPMEDIEICEETDTYKDEMDIAKDPLEANKDNINTGQQSVTANDEKLLRFEEKPVGMENPNVKGFEVNVYEVLSSSRQNVDQDETYQGNDNGELLAV